MLDCASQAKNGDYEKNAGAHGQSGQDTGVREVGERLGGHHHSYQEQRKSLWTQVDGRMGSEVWKSLWTHVKGSMEVLVV